jgi:16S rRNA pseudouridine516 synthase
MAVAILMKIRLDKYLTEMGCGSRSQVKKEIAKGFVVINDQIEKQSDRKVDTQKDQIFLKGELISYSGYEYYMLNKPAGVVSATEDRKERTVIDLIKETKRKDLFPAGRLDKDTEGLLLITNDGKLAHRLLSPKKHVDKVYYAKVNGIVTEKDVEWFKRGVDIGDEKLTMPAVLEILSVHKEQKIQEEQWINGEKRAEQPEGDSEILLTIREGRFHQVKRMFHAAGKEVVYLKRIRFGTLTLDPLLNPGEYRKLTEEEVKQLC